jgi:ABC-type transporter Mla MlaB component
LDPPEESSANHVTARLPPEPRTIVLLFEGPIDPADVQGLCERLSALIGGCDADVVICDVGAVDSNAVTIDALARMQLTARRLGRQVRLRDACDELKDLLALIGLSDVVPCVGSVVESRGQTEQWEQGRGVEEEGDPADPAG